MVVGYNICPSATLFDTFVPLVCRDYEYLDNQTPLCVRLWLNVFIYRSRIVYMYSSRVTQPFGDPHDLPQASTSTAEYKAGRR